MAASTVKLELVKPVRIEHDPAEIERLKRWHQESRVENFAENLEVARMIWRRYKHLVEAAEFPEPYRSAIIEGQEYDPEVRAGIDVNDLHLSDAERADAADEEFALEVLAKRHQESQQAACKALQSLRVVAPVQ